MWFGVSVIYLGLFVYFLTLSQLTLLLPLSFGKPESFVVHAKAYLGNYKTSMMEHFVEIVNG